MTKQGSDDSSSMSSTSAMPAMVAIEEIANPRDVIQRIYASRSQILPQAVEKHFHDLFFPHAVHQLPSLDIHHPPESYVHGTLVRFRAMIQDTSLQNEVYLAKLNDNRCGGWGIQPAQDDYESDSFDSSRLATASVLWAVSVPAESEWRATEISQPDSTSFPVHRSSQPHKFPIPGAPHVGVRVKIYDDSSSESLHSTDVVIFVGITSTEPLSSEDESSPEVPVLHVLCHEVVSANTTFPTIDSTVRDDLLDWISSEALGGDKDAAEWLLLQLTSKVHTRAVPLLPPSLMISRFPQPSTPELLPTLSYVLAELLPQYLPITLSLDLLNTTPFLPESKEEDLHSGYLQLPPGTTTLLTESGVQEGKLLEKGIMNVRAIQDVMNSQTVEYIFPFSGRFTFHTNISIIVLSEGRKSAFFQTSINIPLQPSDTTSNLYKPKNEISFPLAERLSAYRSYIAVCKSMSEKVQVSEQTSKHIQDDFVHQRQQNSSMTADELIQLMNVARLLAASQLLDEVTIDVWEQAKELNGCRQARLCSVEPI